MRKITAVQLTDIDYEILADDKVIGLIAYEGIFYESVDVTLIEGQSLSDEEYDKLNDEIRNNEYDTL